MKEKSPLNVASLTLGIISIVTALFWYLTIPAGVLAVIFGVKGIKKQEANFGKAGLITGIIGLSLFLLIYIGFVIILLIGNSYY